MALMVIVGGGIGGLALAAAMRVRAPGFECIVYERARELREVGAALGVWPNATRVLRRLGCLEGLEKTSYVAPAGALRHWRGKVLRRLSGMSTDAPAIFAHRADLLAVLRGAVPHPPEASLRLDHACTGFERAEAEGAAGGWKVRAVFANQPASPWADVLVGADGINSVVRGQLLGDGAAVYRGYVAWRAVTKFSSPEIVGETWGRGQRFGFIPLGQERVGWWATANVAEREVAGVMAQGAAAWKKFLLERYGGWHAPIPELLRRTEEEALLCNPIADREVGERWGEGVVTLLGDAAHPTTPNLGQGACMAIEDAAVLAGRVGALRPGADVAEALRGYEKLRAGRARLIVKESRKFGRMGQWTNPLACWVRDVGLRFAPESQLAKQFRTLWEYDAWAAGGGGDGAVH